MNRVEGPAVALRAALLLAALSVAPAIPAQTPPPQVTYTVNTTDDLIDDDVSDGVCHTSANNCSLRAAVIQANHLTTADMIAVIRVPAGVFVLTRTEGSAEENTDLDLTTPLGANQVISIHGDGSGRTIIDGNHANSVIYVETGRTAIIANVTIRHGDNASDGGGIHNNGGFLTVAECVIEENHVTIGLGTYGSTGAGIYNANFGSLTLLNSTVRANTGDLGAGIFQAGTATIRGSTIEGNAADDGGGIYNAGQLVIVDSTLSGNSATSDGGGIYADSEEFLYNISVIGNIADLDHDENGGLGGGLYAEPGARFVVVNSLIAGNAVNGGLDASDCDGTFEVYGFNLFRETTACTFTGNGGGAVGFVSPDTTGPLQDNGGPTATHALLVGNEGIDGTTDSLGCVDETGATLMTDQRGAPRIAGVRCDVGAFEYGATVPIEDTIFSDGFE